MQRVNCLPDSLDGDVCIKASGFVAWFSGWVIFLTG